ncbi:MAG: DUF1190 domain-containing protein [Oceanospirillaceae bacterium]|nr:DUF1190 domain-containing protein [Oceanospirillaceae bacterium]MCP5335969.1 DUF1190 domain-containing protein [Oceanospirillaceae bacterium]MCP5350914.1 DUF1190 domain-containing protein [Oceanospirillaceae bacterium]
MKRSRFINLDAMRKATMASTLALGACSQPQEKYIVVQDVEDCLIHTCLNEQQCETAYKTAKEEAQRTANKYYLRSDCEAEFGNNNCEDTPNADGFYTPKFAGFPVTQTRTDANGNRVCSARPHFPMFAYSGFGNGFMGNRGFASSTGQAMTADGKNTFSAEPDKIARGAAPQPRPTQRAGFGSTVVRGSNYSFGG